MVTILATDRAGKLHEIAGETGLSLMQNLKDIGGMDIAAICGGSCACATCHVYIDADWFGRLEPADASEQELVSETIHYKENSRLSCQIPVEDALNGLRLTLAPEE